jgi:hypothetical protein
MRGDHMKSSAFLKSHGYLRHGHARRDGMSKTYHTWRGMIQRCHNPKAANYPRFGGKGIRVCPRWRTSFLHFLEDMGERPFGMTLDRKNGRKGYSRANCRWRTPKQQVANRHL